jgi:hypothetical protein
MVFWVTFFDIKKGNACTASAEGTAELHIEVERAATEMNTFLEVGIGLNDEDGERRGGS